MQSESEAVREAATSDLTAIDPVNYLQRRKAVQLHCNPLASSLATLLSSSRKPGAAPTKTATELQVLLTRIDDAKFSPLKFRVSKLD